MSAMSKGKSDTRGEVYLWIFPQTLTNRPFPLQDKTVFELLLSSCLQLNKIF